MAVTPLAVAPRMPSTCSAMVLTALAVCPASPLTSAATTAKPFPASPARAASMVAFSDSRLVRLAISRMISRTSPIRVETSANWRMVPSASSALPTASLVMAIVLAIWLAISRDAAANSSVAAATALTLIRVSSEAVVRVLYRPSMRRMAWAVSPVDALMVSAWVITCLMVPSTSPSRASARDSSSRFLIKSLSFSDLIAATPSNSIICRRNTSKARANSPVSSVWVRLGMSRA